MKKNIVSKKFVIVGSSIAFAPVVAFAVVQHINPKNKQINDHQKINNKVSLRNNVK